MKPSPAATPRCRACSAPLGKVINKRIIFCEECGRRRVQRASGASPEYVEQLRRKVAMLRVALHVAEKRVRELERRASPELALHATT